MMNLVTAQPQSSGRQRNSSQAPPLPWPTPVISNTPEKTTQVKHNNSGKVFYIPGGEASLSSFPSPRGGNVYHIPISGPDIEHTTKEIIEEIHKRLLPILRPQAKLKMDSFVEGVTTDKLVALLNDVTVLSGFSNRLSNFYTLQESVKSMLLNVDVKNIEQNLITKSAIPDLSNVKQVAEKYKALTIELNDIYETYNDRILVVLDRIRKIDFSKIIEESNLLTKMANSDNRHTIEQGTFNAPLNAPLFEGLVSSNNEYCIPNFDLLTGEIIDSSNKQSENQSESNQPKPAFFEDLGKMLLTIDTDIREMFSGINILLNGDIDHPVLIGTTPRPHQIIGELEQEIQRIIKTKNAKTKNINSATRDFQVTNFTATTTNPRDFQVTNFTATAALPRDFTQLTKGFGDVNMTTPRLNGLDNGIGEISYEAQDEIQAYLDFVKDAKKNFKNQELLFKKTSKLLQDINKLLSKVLMFLLNVKNKTVDFTVQTLATVLVTSVMLMTPSMFPTIAEPLIVALNEHALNKTAASFKPTDIRNMKKNIEFITDAFISQTKQISANNSQNNLSNIVSFVQRLYDDVSSKIEQDTNNMETAVSVPGPFCLAIDGARSASICF